jgi:hypothetical protein
MPPTQQKSTANPSSLDLMLGGLPAAANGGQNMAALAQMIGPGQNLRPYLQQAGTDYADQLDQMMMNPMAAWY